MGVYKEKSVENKASLPQHLWGLKFLLIVRSIRSSRPRILYRQPSDLEYYRNTTEIKEICLRCILTSFTNVTIEWGNYPTFRLGNVFFFILSSPNIKLINCPWLKKFWLDRRRNPGKKTESPRSYCIENPGKKPEYIPGIYYNVNPGKNVENPGTDWSLESTDSGIGLPSSLDKVPPVLSTSWKKVPLVLPANWNKIPPVNRPTNSSSGSEQLYNTENDFNHFETAPPYFDLKPPDPNVPEQIDEFISNFIRQNIRNFKIIKQNFKN